MASTTSQNTNTTKRLETSVPVPNTNALTARGDSSSTGVETKKPYESRKSAEELKLRLASAVTAKIAISKDGNRNLSSTNRGIGFLLQRKDQQENRLNTKDILFQKTARNNGEKLDRAMEKTSNNSIKTARSQANKAELQKSLLNALLNSRAPSGTGEVKNTAKDNRLGVDGNIDRRSTMKSLSENAANKSKLDNNAHTSNSGQMENSKLGDASKINGSIPINNVKTSANKNGKILLSRTKALNQSGTSEMESESANGTTNGGIIERAKHIERLLGQRKPRDIAHVESNFAVNGTLSNGENNSKVATKGITNAKSESIGLKKTETLEGKSIFNKNGTQDIASVNGTNTEMFSRKKSPPPVAKKPSREDVQKAKKISPLITTARQQNEINSSGKISPQNVTQPANKSTPGKVGVRAKVNGFYDKNASTLLSNGERSTTNAALSEDLLEKLEASIGSFKIAAFQAIEDFSTLRMKAYRVRSELDQLKRDREKRMPLVY